MKSRLLKRRPPVGASLSGRQNYARTLGRLLATVAGLSALHVAAMVGFEGMAPFDALWLTATTLTSVGYGDLAAATPAGRLATMLLIYLGGIWVAFRAAGTYFDQRAERRERMRLGEWRWTMRDHVLILNVPSDDAESYVMRLVREFRDSGRFRDAPIELVGRCFAQGLPRELRDLGVVHQVGDAWAPEWLARADAAEAAAVVVLAASEIDPVSDSIALDIVHRLRELGARGTVVAEAVADENRERLKRMGADAVIRPLRGYPEMIVRAVAAPGAEAILEDLFTSRGEELWRFAAAVAGWSWSEVVARLLAEDIGLPIAYRTPDDRVVVNPPGSTIVEAEHLYVLVREGNERDDAAVAALLRRAPG